MNKKQKELKRETVKRIFIGQILTTVGVVCVLIAAINLLFRLLSWDLGLGGTSEASSGWVFSTMEVTISLGCIGVAGIIAGAVMRSSVKK